MAVLKVGKDIIESDIEPLLVQEDDVTSYYWVSQGSVLYTVTVSKSDFKWTMTKSGSINPAIKYIKPSTED